MSEQPQLLPESRGHTPLRGTQSFVAVMGRVWHTPSLTGIEVLWRWVAGAALVWWVWVRVGQGIYQSAVQTNSVSLGISSSALGVPSFWMPVAAWLVVWVIAFVVGRRFILRKLGAEDVRWPVLMAITVLRLVAFGAVIVVWLGVLGWLVSRIHWGGHLFTSDQPLVGAFAVAVVTTLALFMLWSVVSWRFWLAMVVAAEEGCGVGEALRRAAAAKAVRSKLVEINLVMGIVKVALLVLALTFSACPLPFQDVSTPSFLAHWWIGVGVLYLVASDFFHVVRLASCVALYRATKS